MMASVVLVLIHVLQNIFVSNVEFVISQYCLVFFLYTIHRAFVKSQIPIYDIILRFYDIDFVISQIHYGIYHNKPLSLINARPAFKKKRGPTAA